MNNTRSSTFSIAIATQIKFNGQLSRNGFVPSKSHVKLSCEVSFQGISIDSLSLVMIGFGFPNGQHTVPGKCIVSSKHLSKRCKITIKKVVVSDEGVYSCLVYYLYRGSVKKSVRDFAMNVTKIKCPYPKIFCHLNNICIEKQEECKMKHECSFSEFRCQNAQCVKKNYRCDDIPDCSDKSDEINCDKERSFSTEYDNRSAFKREDNFVCNSGEWISPDARCNGIQDCSDGSDEIDCAKHRTEFIGYHGNMNVSDSNDEDSLPNYGLTISMMVILSSLMFFFTVCIKQRQINLEDEYFMTVEAYGFAT